MAPSSQVVKSILVTSQVGHLKASVYLSRFLLLLAIEIGKALDGGFSVSLNELQRK